MTKKIFLSYRQDDASGHTELLYSRLANRYGQGAIFRDVHSIDHGEQFRKVIEQSLSQCAIVLVVMSKQWGRIAGPDGVARLNDPDDSVRWEIESANARAVPVLPVLVGGAKMPDAIDLPESIRELRSIKALELSEERWEEDFRRLVKRVNEMAPVLVAPMVDVNPFTIRNAIRDDAFFYDRTNERKMLRNYLIGRQNCQIVGPRRIGKSSVLLYVQRHAVEWCPTAKIAYLDLQDALCHTLRGWLQEIATRLGIQRQLRSLVDLSEAIDDLLAQGVQPILCLDEFGELTRRPKEFKRDAFLTLRSCGQKGMSILTAAPERLSQLTNPQDKSSPFFNTFPTLQIGAFTATNARDYVQQERAGVPAFTKEEVDRILEFAQGHPLALQSACFHVLAAKESDEGLPAALDRAREDCRQ